MTTWTSSAPITLRVKCRCWMPNDTCSTWWSARTTKPANPSPTTKCAGSAAIRLLLTLLRSFLKSSSVSLHSPWERSSAKEKATIISVSVTAAFCKIQCNGFPSSSGGDFSVKVKVLVSSPEPHF